MLLIALSIQALTQFLSTCYWSTPSFAGFEELGHIVLAILSLLDFLLGSEEKYNMNLSSLSLINHSAILILLPDHMQMLIALARVMLINGK